MRQTRRGFLGTIAAIAAAVPLAGKAEAAADVSAIDPHIHTTGCTSCGETSARTAYERWLDSPEGRQELMERALKLRDENAAMTGTLTPGANLVSGKDDAAYIQGMIDQAHANGGGIVTLEPRQYRVGELMLPPDVRLDIPLGATVNGYDWSAHA